jgi:hypothetical protein
LHNLLIFICELAGVAARSHIKIRESSGVG